MNYKKTTIITSYLLMTLAVAFAEDPTFNERAVLYTKDTAAGAGDLTIATGVDAYYKGLTFSTQKTGGGEQTEDAILTVETGATLTLKPDETDSVSALYADGGNVKSPKFYIYGTMNVYNSNNNTYAINLSSPYPAYVISGTAEAKATLNSYGNVYISTNNANAKLTSNEHSIINVFGSVDSTITDGTMTIAMGTNSTSTLNGTIKADTLVLAKGKFSIGENAILNANTVNIASVLGTTDITLNNSDYFANKSVAISGGYNTNLSFDTMNEQVNMGSLDIFIRGDNIFNMSFNELSDDGISFDEITLKNNSDNIGSIVITDFASGLLTIGNDDDLSFTSKYIEDTLNWYITDGKRTLSFSATDKDGEAYTDFYFDSTTGALMGSLASVPEPSTYAMIFGALALGLAIYRKRK